MRSVLVLPHPVPAPSDPIVADPSRVSPPASPSTLRRIRVPLRIGLRLLAYFLGCWGFAGVLIHGLFPHAELVVVAVAIYTTVILLVVLRWRGFPFYPGAAFRLFVVRPFW